MHTRREFFAAAATVSAATSVFAKQPQASPSKGEGVMPGPKHTYPKVGVYSSVSTSNMTDYSAEVTALGDRGISSVYVDEDRDALVSAAAMISGSREVEIATGWCVPGRAPVLLAKAAVWLDAFSGQRFTLGIGINSPVVASFLGFAWAQRHALLQDYLLAVRRALYAEPESSVQHDGPFFKYVSRGSHDADGRRAGPPIVIKVTDLPQFRMAGISCDGLVLGQMTPFAAYVAAGRDLVGAGAASAGRQLGSFRVSKMIWTMVDEDSKSATDRLRGLVASKIVDNKFDNKELAIQAGFSDEVDEITARSVVGDKAGAAQAVTEEMWRAYGLAGTPDEVRAQAAAYASKVDTLVCMGSMFGLPDFGTYLREHHRVTDAIVPR